MTEKEKKKINRPIVVRDDEYTFLCEWEECRHVLSTMKDFLLHIAAHIVLYSASKPQEENGEFYKTHVCKMIGFTFHYLLTKCQELVFIICITYCVAATTNVILILSKQRWGKKQIYLHDVVDTLSQEGTKSQTLQIDPPTQTVTTKKKP